MLQVNVSPWCWLGRIPAAKASCCSAPATPRRANEPGQPPLLPVATGSYVGEGFDCPPWTPCSSPPISFKGAWPSTPGGSCAPTLAKPPPKIGDYVNRPGVPEARIHRGDQTTSPPPACSPHRWPNAPPDTPALGFPDARHITHTPSSRAAREIIDSPAG